MLALFLFYGLGLAGFVGDADGTGLLAHQSEVMAASGIAAGLVYWLAAGRKAGLWQSRK